VWKIIYLFIYLFILAENQQKGAVGKGVYAAYIKSGGSKWTMALLVILFVITQIFYSATDIWLKDW
jgi:hypothetical protein